MGTSTYSLTQQGLDWDDRKRHVERWREANTNTGTSQREYSNGYGFAHTAIGNWQRKLVKLGELEPFEVK